MPAEPFLRERAGGHQIKSGKHGHAFFAHGMVFRIARQKGVSAVGMLAMEYSTFAVDGRTDLNLVIFNPATPKDVAKIRKLIKPQAKKKSSR